MRYSHVLKAVYDTPWAVTVGTLDIIDEVVRLRLADAPLTEVEISARVAAAASTYGDRLGAQDVGRVRVIPLYGVITPRAGLMSYYSGGTSLDELRGAIGEAMDDPDVGAILLDVDSPGGSVDGLEEFASWLRAVRAQALKPIASIANFDMESAAYYVAAQTNEIIATPSGRVGSVGTVARHREHAGADEIAGVKTTLIASDPVKIDGNEYEPISDTHLATMRDTVNFYARQFVADVAKGRGITPAQVTERYSGGAILQAPDALRAGMVDRIESLPEAIDRLNRSRVVRQGARAEGDPPEVDAVGCEAAEPTDPDPAEASVAASESTPPAPIDLTERIAAIKRPAAERSAWAANLRGKH